MSTGMSGSGDRSAVSGEPQDPQAKPRTPSWLPVAVVAAIAVVLGLVVGVLIGGRTDLLDRATTSNDLASGAPVAVGPVREVLEGPVDGADFELPVFNSLKTQVDASLVALEGGFSSLRSDTTRQIAPGTWAVIPFSISPNCDSRGRRPVASVRLRLRTPDERAERSLPLPEEGKVLLDYHEAFCAAGPTIRRNQLLGVWIVEDVFGPDTYLAGIHLMRFSRDGSFAADPEGGLDTDEVGVRGRYRLKNELLDIDVDGGYGCDAPSHVTWRVTINEIDNQLMSMVWLRGDCPDGAPGDVWVARRVLRAPGVPKEP